ncbi:SurA N-terminal domain-containing protein [Natranaerofaba carboxydovora]|uniref:SurA N-terminal domain-containing protein n=1 Tax=Natranaerofaba carboxydovora TaxID=2742683 RepID=UPI001F132CE6|nr:SurA N-terminal domain-containing protein [Natranaerofaba carboxydovora]UMZ73121.1 hypothetical protein ACONDI_00674 [Natranaerofaba carboxydovora]
MKIKILILALVMALSVTFIGCGNGEGEEKEKEKEESSKEMQQDDMEIPEFEEVKDDLKEDVTMQKIGEVIEPKLEEWREDMEIETEGLDEDVAAVVNGEEISESDISNELDQQAMMQEMQGMEVTDEQREQMRQDVIESMISREILFQKALEEGFEPDEEFIQEQMGEIEAQFESEEQFNEALEEEGLSKEELESMVSEDSKVSAFIESFRDEVEVTEEELKEVYDQQIEQMEMQMEMQKQMMEQKEGDGMDADMMKEMKELEDKK